LQLAIVLSKNEFKMYQAKTSGTLKILGYVVQMGLRPESRKRRCTQRLYDGVGSPKPHPASTFESQTAADPSGNPKYATIR